LSNNTLYDKDKTTILRNEKVPSLYNYYSKTEEGIHDNKIHSIKNGNKYLKENTFRKTTAYLMKKDLDYKDLDKNSLTSKEDSNNKIKIKEKIFQKSFNNLNLNLKKIKTNVFFDSTKKEGHKKIKLENTQRNYYYKKSSEKALIDFTKKYKTINNDKTNKKYHNILTQTINDDENNKNIKTELINEYNDDNCYNNNENVKVVDCNVVNLNLLDIPNHKNENSSYKYFKRNSLKINLKSSFKSIDKKSRIKISPAFGRTSYAFYNIKNIQEMFNKANLNVYNTQSELDLKRKLLLQ
jgi:hypothetical protein